MRADEPAGGMDVVLIRCTATTAARAGATAAEPPDVAPPDTGAAPTTPKTRAAVIRIREVSIDPSYCRTGVRHWAPGVVDPG